MRWKLVDFGAVWIDLKSTQTQIIKFECHEKIPKLVQDIYATFKGT